MTSTVEEALSRFTGTLAHDGIPSGVGHRVKLLLIDALGCALVGDLAEETAQVVATAERATGTGSSSIVGGGRSSPMGAVLVNSYLTTAMTVCDVYRPAHCHITPLVVPPALVVGEQEGTTGAELLTALTVGMEATVRVAMGLDYPAFRERGWHSPGVIGPLGSAATIARIRGYDEATTLSALGLAGTQAAGSYLSWGTPAVKFHQARGAMSGLLAADLAGGGFRGGVRPLTAPDGGIYHTHSNGGRPELVVRGLGEHWELEDVAIRLWPGASPVQAMLTGILEIMEATGVDAKGVERVEIAISPEDHGTHAGFAQPSSTFEALLSYAYLCSAVLHDGEVWFDQVRHPRYMDPELLAFARERVDVVSDDERAVNTCRLRVRLEGGAEHETVVDAARGTPANPASDDEVAAKFHRCADERLGERRARELLQALMELESCDDVRRLWDLLRP